MNRSTQSVVMDLLAAMPDRLSVGAVIHACGVLTLSPNSVRVALTRLKSKGMLESVGRGHYRVGPAGLPLKDIVVGWRDSESQLRSWDGSWLAVHHAAVPRSDRTAQRAQARALRLLGFREVSKGLSVRPNNLSAPTQDIQARLAGLGLAAESIVFTVTEFDATTEHHARGLWDCRSLNAGYRRMIECLAQAKRDIRGVDARRAARECFSVGGEAIRMIVADPWLPDDMVDGDARRRLVAEMVSFDRLGRERWKQVFAEQVAEQVFAEQGELRHA